MYTTKKDFDIVKPNPRIAELTNISDGTLSTICRSSGFFDIKDFNIGFNQYETLDAIRAAWKLCTAFQLENDAHMPIWQESWGKFERYIHEQANELFHNTISQIDGITLPKINESEIVYYRAYGTPKGEMKLHNNGVITREEGLITHVVIAMLDGKDGLKKLLC